MCFAAFSGEFESLSRFLRVFWKVFGVFSRCLGVFLGVLKFLG